MGKFIQTLCRLLLLIALTSSEGITAWASEATDEAVRLSDEFRYRDAERTLRKAATEGDRAAQLRLGMMLYYADSLYSGAIRQDRREAQVWFRRAAAEGCEQSRHFLVHMDATARH